MKIDVVIVSYNQEHYIRQAVESVLMQRLPADHQVRIIIADDYSNDATVDTIRKTENDWCKASEKDGLMPNQVTFEYLEPMDKNIGMCYNYQRAFAKCEGDYIALLEGDDYWSSPYHLKQHIEFLDAHRECSMSMNNIVYHYQESDEFEIQGWIYRDYPHYVNTKEQISEGNQLGNLSACVLRACCVKSLPEDFYELKFADWMLGVMLSQQGLLAILKEHTSVYRINKHSQWASRTVNDQNQSILKSIEIYDRYQKGRYHLYWEICKEKVRNDIHPSRKHNMHTIKKLIKKLIKRILP